MGYVGKITAGGTTGSVGSTLFGTCPTAASTGTKAVTCPDFDKLIEGVTVFVLFENENTLQAPQLNVNSTGAKTIIRSFSGSSVSTYANRFPAGLYAFTYVKVGSQNFWLMAHDIPDDATSSYAGLMSAADKTKLDGIYSGAEVNQNAFSNVKVGGSTVAADSKTDTLELVAGSNVTLTPDTTNDKVTIAATDTTYSDFGGATASAAGSHGLVPAPASGGQDKLLFGDGGWGGIGLDLLWIPAASVGGQAPNRPSSVTLEILKGSSSIGSVALPVMADPSDDSFGFMTGDDKTKLDGIESGANAYVHPAYDAATAAAVKVGRDASGHVVVGSALTASDVGASATGHKHAAGDINSGTLGVARGGTGASTLGAGVVYHSASGTGALSIASAANLVSAIGTTAVNRATADANGNDIAATYATKSEISGLYRYKGSVASESALPSTGQSTGDVYNIEAASSYGGAGANVAWNGTAWDALGEVFTITALTNAEIDAICTL